VNQFKGKGGNFVGTNSDMRLNKKTKAKFPFATPQDEVANGDRDEDKELEDEDDPNDVIADDNGFVNQFKGKGGNFSQLTSDLRLGTLQAKRSLMKLR